jgi:hypothetical protein
MADLCSPGMPHSHVYCCCARCCTRDLAQPLIAAQVWPELRTPDVLLTDDKVVTLLHHNDALIGAAGVLVSLLAGWLGTHHCWFESGPPSWLSPLARNKRD